MDAVVVGELVEPQLPANVNDQKDWRNPVTGRFRILLVIKGNRILSEKEFIEVSLPPSFERAGRFLILGAGQSFIEWGQVRPISSQAIEYIQQLPKLSNQREDRLKFFYSFLESDDETISVDAYNEFAKAPYSDVLKSKARFDRSQLISWITASEVPGSRRRLYLTLLGVCGQPDDSMVVEGWIRAGTPIFKSSLDALIGCYLTLKGASGLPLVEELFLSNEDSDYADIYAAVMALRFHGSEGNAIPRRRIIESMRCLLERPDLADLVIADLARWKDWESRQTIVQLFKDSKGESQRVRVPIIVYLRSCPLPEAAANIRELQKLDPAAVEQADKLFHFRVGS